MGDLHDELRDACKKFGQIEIVKRLVFEENENIYGKFDNDDWVSK